MSCDRPAFILKIYEIWPAVFSGRFLAGKGIRGRWANVKALGRGTSSIYVILRGASSQANRAEERSSEGSPDLIS